jgi:adenylate cyclase
MNKRTSVIQRRLAAIFYADMEGYVRLMNAGEVVTLCLLISHRGIRDRQIIQFRGRTANTAGDSILAGFPSVVGAVQCALGIQERIARRVRKRLNCGFRLPSRRSQYRRVATVRADRR